MLFRGSGLLWRVSCRTMRNGNAWPASLMPRRGRWRLQAVRTAFVGKFNKVTTAAYRADCGLRHAQHALAAWASWLIRHAGLGGRRVGSRPSPDTSPPVVGEGFAPGAHGGEAQEGGLARQALEEGPGRRAHGGAPPASRAARGPCSRRNDTAWRDQGSKAARRPRHARAGVWPRCDGGAGGRGAALHGHVAP